MESRSTFLATDQFSTITVNHTCIVTPVSRATGSWTLNYKTTVVSSFDSTKPSISEPPDIGNWFSSYGYESPVDSEGFVIRESIEEENEKNCDEFGKTRCKVELDFVIENTNSNVLANDHENQSSSEIPDSSYSPSGVSEPPNIRNWFSSYVYDSFVLDTNDDVKDSISHENECEKEEEANLGAFIESRSCDQMGVGQGISSNGSFEDDDQNKKSLCKISDSMDSPSLFTEPPDVKNWFSSYAYESLVLDTSNEFGDSLHLEREPKEDELVAEDSEGEKEEKMDIIQLVRSRYEEVDVENVHSKGILESINKDIERIERIERKESTSSQNNLCSVKSKPIQKISQEVCSVSLNVTSSANNKKSPTMEESSESNIRIEGFASGSSGARKRIHKSNDKENENTENGFVTTRKKGCARTEKEDLEGRPQGILLECTRNFGTVCVAGEKDVTVNRKVLTETTNLQLSEAIGVTGKWRCPLKSKPNRGPPLKQLRLERWIHKV
ncbi:hypothetical protein LWI29_016041 [Acer saccharum]|uniref:Uncharacterized protein n=1 Tax=Acer saccharum TaxID=4024 RepID=A0AA39VNV3_ACESA|nr:hypothetical protein LWI29_016041 [Acer saccharum]